MIKLLLLEDYRGNAAVTMDYDLFDNFKKLFDVKYLGSRFLGYDDKKTLKQMLGDFKPDFIFFGTWFINRMIKQPNPELIKEIKKYDCPRAALVCDFIYRVEEHLKIWNELGIKIILCHNDSRMLQEDYGDIKFIYFPFSFNNKLFKDYKLQKEYDFGIFGWISSELYPMRERVYNLVSKEKDIKLLQWKTVSNSSDATNNPSVEEYARAINKCKITFTDGQFREVLVAKYNELAACNTLVMSPKFKKSNDLEWHGFKDNESIVYVEYDDSDEKILAKIKYLLNNTSELNRISRNGYELVHSKHTDEMRARQFRYLVENLLKNEYSQPKFS